MGTFKSKFKSLSEFDRAYGQRYVAGVDEVGRGALAGPIVAACVIYDTESICDHEESLFFVRDSKTINKAKMQEISNCIKATAVAYEIFFFDNNDIDEFGIQTCNRELMNGAVRFSIEKAADILLVDGTIRPNEKYGSLKCDIFPQADGKSLAVASASIVAKNYRDLLMKSLDVDEEYGFESNVGYGAERHLAAIVSRGTTPYHRLSFLKKYIGEGV